MFICGNFRDKGIFIQNILEAVTGLVEITDPF